MAPIQAIFMWLPKYYYKLYIVKTALHIPKFISGHEEIDVSIEEIFEVHYGETIHVMI